MGARLHRHSQIGDFLELMSAQKALILLLVQRMFPCLVRSPFVFPALVTGREADSRVGREFGCASVSDSVTGEWRSLGEQPFGYPKWSGDGKSIYGAAGPVGTVDAVRIKVATRRSEETARTDFKPNGVIGYGKWLGWTEDWEPLTIRDLFDTDLSHRPGRLNLKDYFCV